MSFTSQNNLERPTEGQPDWDTSFNSNFDILDRGYHGAFVAGTAIKTGDILWQGSGNIVYPYNPRSLGLKAATAISYKAVSSGETDYFLIQGIVTSISVWSGKITPGKPIFASPSTAGFAVGSYSAAAYPVGLALRPDAVLFAPGRYNEIPEKITAVYSVIPIFTTSYHRFSVDAGNRGFIRMLEVTSVTSGATWALKFHSGSARVSSELLYETKSGGISSIYMLDGAGWPYENTDTSSPGIIFGEASIMTGSSATFNVTVVAERFR